MKQRIGFVSNSSSCSFIIFKNDIYKNSMDLAEQMMVERDWSDDTDQKKIKTLKRKVKLKNVDGEQETIYSNIFFRTCNYDTYIVDLGDKLAVQTCNNHNYWQSTLSKAQECRLSDLTIEELKLLNLSIEDLEYGEIYNLENKHKFYSIDSGFIGYEVSSWDNPNGVRCKNCWQDAWQTEEGLVCPTCGRNKEEIMARNKEIEQKKIQI